MGLTINNAFNYKGKDFTGVYVDINVTLNDNTLYAHGRYYFNEATYEANKRNSLELHDMIHEPDNTAIENVNFAYDRATDGEDIAMLCHVKFIEELNKLGYDDVTNNLTV